MLHALQCSRMCLSCIGKFFDALTLHLIERLHTLSSIHALYITTKEEELHAIMQKPLVRWEQGIVPCGRNTGTSSLLRAIFYQKRGLLRIPINFLGARRAVCSIVGAMPRSMHLHSVPSISLHDCTLRRNQDPSRRRVAC